MKRLLAVLGLLVVVAAPAVADPGPAAPQPVLTGTLEYPSSLDNNTGIAMSGDGHVVAQVEREASSSAPSGSGGLVHLLVSRDTGGSWHVVADLPLGATYGHPVVAMSGDGRTVAAEFPLLQTPDTGVRPPTVYVYRFVADHWVRTAALDYRAAPLASSLGLPTLTSSIALSHNGTRLAVGETTTKVQNGSYIAVGAVPLFDWNGTKWSLTRTLLGPDVNDRSLSDGDDLVTLSGDGNEVVAEFGGGGGSGGAPGLVRSQLLAFTAPGGWVASAPLLTGRMVAMQLSRDGATLAVSTRPPDPADPYAILPVQVRVLRLAAAGWRPSATFGQSPNCIDGYYARWIAVTANGDTLQVGCSWFVDGSSTKGAMVSYRYSWFAGSWHFAGLLRPANTDPFTTVAYGVALSADGYRIAFGGVDFDVAEVGVFDIARASA